MAGITPGESRQRELWRRLDTVMDPELDESVVAMGFVESATVATDGRVAVAFRLPTYWCSPNFAFLMLEDLREALTGLSWAPQFQLTLRDHLMGEEINAALAAGQSFDEIVGRLAPDADIRGLRETFSMKAFKRRQEAVLLAARASGIADAAILRLTCAELGTLEAPVARYLAALAARFPDHHAGASAFVTWEGAALRADDLPRYMAALRSVRINMEFSGALCRGLRESRYHEVVRGEDGEPTLADFVLGRAGVSEMQEQGRR